MRSIIRHLIEETADNRYELYREYISPTWVKMLRTIGFDRTYIRAEGPYLFDQSGNRFLDFKCNWGTFNFGRNHPTIRESLLDIIQSDFPGWIAFDAPLLAGILTRRLCEKMRMGSIASISAIRELKLPKPPSSSFVLPPENSKSSTYGGLFTD